MDEPDWMNIMSRIWLVRTSLTWQFCRVLAPFIALSLHADIVTDWNSLLLDAVRNESTTAPLAARNMAIVHTAIYDAVNAIDRSHQFYFVNPLAPAGASQEAAAVGAAHQALVNLYPSQRAAFDSALNTSLASIPNGPAKTDGLAWGQSVANSILTWRGTDGASTTVPYIPSMDPGAWRRTPPTFRPPDLPQWPYVTPFAMTSGAQFRPAGPPALNSSQYAADFNQVKELGAANSPTRTPEQTQTARFWSDFSFTVTPPGHWNQIAQNVATSQGNTLAENARLFALLNIAMADAGIVAWDAKYVYNFWRPVTAIQLADIDGNPDTIADPNWTPLLNTPPFPEYTSGHSTFSAAAAEELADFYGTDEIQFTVGSDAFPGVTQLPGGGLSFNLTGLAGRTYTLQASTNLQAWTDISTNVATTGTLSFTNLIDPAFPKRFFRLKSP